MTKELQEIRAPIKLFRAASLLQVSKDTIVDFLQSRGYSIPNKPTAVLDEEMLQLVLEKFRKDLLLAIKRREKIEKTTHHTTRKTAKEEPLTPPAAPEERTPESLAPQPSEEILTEEPPGEELPHTEEEAPLPVEEATVQHEEPAPIQDGGAPTVELPSPPPAPEEPQEERAEAEPTPAAIAEETPPPPAEPTGEETPQPPPETPAPAERRREVISATPGGGLKILGRVDLPILERRRRPTKPSAAESPKTPSAKPTPPSKRPPSPPSRPRKTEQPPSPPLASPPPPPPPSPTPTKKPTKRTLKLGEESTPKVRRRQKLEEISQEEIQEMIRQTLIGVEEGAAYMRTRLRQIRRAKREEKRQRQQTELEQEARLLRVTEFLTAGELAQMLGVPASELITKSLQIGQLITINQRLDRDLIELLAAEYGYQVEFQDAAEVEELHEEPDPPESLNPRPPIVTIMGHVDHGKTTLLDYIRQSNIVAGEAGGITQHIGAYQVQLPNGQLITFLDTPGHEAFTAMRARGAQVTDIVVLVVAADDAVMPQTVEAINHARAANVPIVVAINKVDKPEANPDRIRQQLAEHGILVEEWGGEYQCVEISALTGKNVDLLLEKILLEAELRQLKANPDRPARGTIIEAHLDKGKGPVATVIVQNGTLRIGDAFVAGLQYGRVRAMYDERGNRVEAAPPSTPVQVTGFDGLPEVGDKLVVVEDERLARQIALRRQQLKREQQARRLRQITLSDLAQRIQAGSSKELRLILKADVLGSVEALTNALLRLSTEEARVSIIHSGVGAITEADVMLAAASEAVIIGFQVQPTAAARKLADAEGVDIRIYQIIYECIEEIQRALEGLLSPELKEEILGHAEVRQVFHISRVGTVAGCYVTDGVIQRNARARVLRDGLPIHTGTIESLKRFKEDVREVNAGYECGLTVSGFQDFQPGDVIEVFRVVEQKRSLKV